MCDPLILLVSFLSENFFCFVSVENFDDWVKLLTNFGIVEVADFLQQVHNSTKLCHHYVMFCDVYDSYRLLRCVDHESCLAFLSVDFWTVGDCEFGTSLIGRQKFAFAWFQLQMLRNFYYVIVYYVIVYDSYVWRHTVKYSRWTLVTSRLLILLWMGLNFDQMKRDRM